MGVEIVPGESIPAETGITDVAVSFTKGCYPGQELVERMDSRAATAPRLLRRLTVAEAKEVGATITTAHGDTVLGFVPRSALPH
jgi:folate-binding protein YgfZ